VKLPALALFERSLRLETRSAVMCWSRVALLGIMLFFLISVQTMARVGWYGAPGLYFVQEMVWANLVFITLAGLSYFASAITEEKEEMMLGLLRMTNLNPVAILLGKSTSRLIGALLLLLAQLPFILLAVTLGGVGLLQIAAAYGTLLAYVFLLCNLALVFSVIFRNTGAAAAVTLFLLFLFFVGHDWAAAIVQDLALSHHVNAFFTDAINVWRDATPSERLLTIFRTGFTGPVVGFQIVSNLVAGVLLFFLAWALFDPCTRAEKDSSPSRFWFGRRKSRRSRIPPRLVGFRAITWKDFTFIGGGLGGLVVKFGVVGVLVAFCNAIAYWNGARLTRELEGGTLIWISLFTTALFLAVESSRIFKDEVRWKTLSSLMTLPISVPELAYRKVAGALAGTLPLLAGFILGVLLVPDKVGNFFDEMFKEPDSFGLLIVMILQYILFLHLTAFLSIVLKRGALPLAFAIQYVGGYFFMLFSALFFGFAGGPGAMISIVGFICVVLTGILHFSIGFRLERVAAQE
jgi:hypothetical protein